MMNRTRTTLVSLSLSAAVAFASLSGALAPIEAQTPARRILFSRAGPGEPGELGVFLAIADGTSELQLAASASLDYDPAWFPDGQSIVFTSERDGSADLYKVRADGSGLTRLTNDPAYDDQASVSPDGKQIVFVSSRTGGKA